MVIKIAYLRMKSYNKDLKVKYIVHMLKKSIRLNKVVMMIKDYKLLIGLEHIHMEQMLNSFKVCKSEMLSKNK